MTKTHWDKTKAWAITVALLTVALILIVQFRAERTIPINCSYLDPVTVDFLAFAAALFLIVEGFYRLHEHKYAPVSKQLTRIIRIAFGCSIATLHIMQFLHK